MPILFPRQFPLFLVFHYSWALKPGNTIKMNKTLAGVIPSVSPCLYWEWYFMLWLWLWSVNWSNKLVEVVFFMKAFQNNPFTPAGTK